MWLIVGANGQLGRCLSNELQKQGEEFLVCSHSELDITIAPQVDDYFRNREIATVINCAAWTAVDDAEDNEAQALKVNYEGPQNLALAAKRSNSRLIQISTDYVFSGDAATPYTVETPASPLNAYGRTKLQGDEAVLEIGEGTFPVVRTAWLYSRFGKNFAKTMASRALQDLPVRVVNDQIGQPTSAVDLARLIIEIAQQSNPPSIIHGTNSEQATWFEFAREIYKLLNVDVELVSPVTSSEFPTRAKRPSYSVLDHSELIGTGISEMRTWQEALSDEMPFIREAVLSELK